MHARKKSARSISDKAIQQLYHHYACSDKKARHSGRVNQVGDEESSLFKLPQTNLEIICKGE